MKKINNLLILSLIILSIFMLTSCKQEVEEVFTKMPVMHINLDKDYPLKNINREDYKKATISLTNLPDEYMLEEVGAEFRGRGHGSWGYSKKGYNIKFNDKQGLFGLSENKHWVIVAGGHDDSLIRSNLAYTIVNDVLDNIKYQTAVYEIEVYINNSYHGVYSLFEQIRADKGRVDINSKFNELDTGYLIEYDAYAEAEGIKDIETFTVPGLRYHFLIKGPKMADYEEKGLTEEEAKAQNAYIRDYVREVYAALFKKDQAKFNELADAKSFIDMYIIHELFKNSDTGWSSFYLYKPKGDKLYAGPAWDFDLSSASREHKNRGDYGYSGFYVSGKASGSAYDASNFTSSELYISLMEQSWFVDLFKERFLEVSDAIKISIENYYNKISTEDYIAAFQRDAERWTKSSNLWEREQRTLKYWLNKRIDWLKEWCEE